MDHDFFGGGKILRLHFALKPHTIRKGCPKLGFSDNEADSSWLDNALPDANASGPGTVLNATFFKLSSLTLALLYASLALFGHALHQHGDCHHSHASKANQHASEAHQQSAESCVCSCRHDNKLNACEVKCSADSADSAGSIDQAVGYRSPHTGHDTSSCAACLLLGQLNTGCAQTASQTLLYEPDSGALAVHTLAGYRTLYRSHVARGPPATLAV